MVQTDPIIDEYTSNENPTPLQLPL